MSQDWKKGNVYYSPELSGLTILETVELTDEPYQYDTEVWWQDKLGNIWYAHDSGCSCPVPFEDYYYNSPDDTNLILVTDYHRNISNL